jgi:phage terminase small subunit
MALTPKQQRFAQEYLLDLNITQAAIRAGYSAKTAYSIGQQNLKKLEVQAYISELQQNRSQRTQITADRVLQEIGRLAFSNVTDIVEFNDRGVIFKRSGDLTAEVTAAISEVSSDVTYHRSPDGEDDEPTPTVKQKIKMHNKVEALKLAAQHLGLTTDFNQAIAALATYGINLKQTDRGWMVDGQDDPTT